MYRLQVIRVEEYYALHMKMKAVSSSKASRINDPVIERNKGPDMNPNTIAVGPSTLTKQLFLTARYILT